MLIQQNTERDNFSRRMETYKCTSVYGMNVPQLTQTSGFLNLRISLLVLCRIGRQVHHTLGWRELPVSPLNRSHLPQLPDLLSLFVWSLQWKGAPNSPRTCSVFAAQKLDIDVFDRGPPRSSDVCLRENESAECEEASEVLLSQVSSTVLSVSVVLDYGACFHTRSEGRACHPVPGALQIFPTKEVRQKLTKVYCT